MKNDRTQARPLSQPRDLVFKIEKELQDDKKKSDSILDYMNKDFLSKLKILENANKQLSQIEQN
jgi:hypothetical protein